LPASLDTPCTMIVATARHPPPATGRIGSYQPAAPATSPTQQREPSGQAHSEHAQHRPYVAPPNLSDCQTQPHGEGDPHEAVRWVVLNAIRNEGRSPVRAMVGAVRAGDTLHQVPLRSTLLRPSRCQPLESRYPTIGPGVASS
jgi:hypothetical protein